MIIYRDVFTKDELFSDAFPVSVSPDGIFYIVEGKTVTRTQGDIDSSLIGGNASAEEVQETCDSSTTRGVDIILNHRLEAAVGFNKKTYMSYIKTYMKAVKTRLEENEQGRVDAFMKDATAAVKAIVKDFDNYECFQGESCAEEGGLGLLNYREDGITPYMLFFKDGIEIEKF